MLRFLVRDLSPSSPDELALRSEASKSRCALSGRPLGATRFEISARGRREKQHGSCRQTALACLRSAKGARTYSRCALWRPFAATRPQIYADGSTGVLSPNSRGTRCSRSGTCRGAAPLSGAFGVAAPQTRLQAPRLTGAPSSAPPTPTATGHQLALRSARGKRARPTGRRSGLADQGLGG